MQSKIKTEFVKRALLDIGKEIDKAQGAAIQKYLNYRTGRLLDDRKFDVSRGDFMDGQLTITHPIYERFLDMKKKKGGSNNVNKWRNRKKKIYPIHNRIIMGNYNRLAYILMYGLTEEVASAIKKDLDNQTI